MYAEELPEWTAGIQDHAVDVQNLADFRDMLAMQP
jgi:hypothetical protein